MIFADDLRVFCGFAAGLEKLTDVSGSRGLARDLSIADRACNSVKGDPIIIKN